MRMGVSREASLSFLSLSMTKWTKHIVSFNEEEDEDTLVEE